MTVSASRSLSGRQESERSGSGEGKLRGLQIEEPSTGSIARKSILPMRGQGSCLLKMGSLTRWTYFHNRLQLRSAFCFFIISE